MIEQLELEVEARAERGKNAARRLRAGGKIPVTLYGLGREPQALAVDSAVMTRILSHPELRNRVLNLKGGAEGAAMAGEYQIDPVTGTLLHVDIRRVDLTQTVRAEVPLAPLGVPYGVKNEGGLEDVVLREVLVECLPADLPEKIEFDISEMRVGHTFRVRDLPQSDKYRYLTPEDAVLVRVVGRAAEEAEAEAEGLESAAAEAEAPSAEPGAESAE